MCWSEKCETINGCRQRLTVKPHIKQHVLEDLWGRVAKIGPSRFDAKCPRQSLYSHGYRDNKSQNYIEDLTPLGTRPGAFLLCKGLEQMFAQISRDSSKNGTVKSNNPKPTYSLFVIVRRCLCQTVVRPVPSELAECKTKAVFYDCYFVYSTPKRVLFDAHNMTRQPLILLKLCFARSFVNTKS